MSSYDYGRCPDCEGEVEKVGFGNVLYILSGYSASEEEYEEDLWNIQELSA